MKYMKAASAIAVSMMAAGTAAGTASATEAADYRAMSLNSGVQQLTDALNTHQPVDSTVQPLLHTATDTAQAVNEARNGDPSKLLGNAGEVAKTAAPMLGGMPAGG
ncbi:hypothetical protein AS594_16820 [Streptomyces agglomeratus]|uniref:Secreted protein n=1 Tax=Streptomyces agglomeratus TaxID=285458 RepID=A0A1E5P969_9ACTN|nr:hypothetical protein [Streptomyces agglomeratus]OEJ25914.1 hypothetical protein AS594_16820 [Streptomyces agglomeratus]OEJ52579.1 hypothetical protein BGK72_19205 [Streptomyces agglomeratus]